MVIKYNVTMLAMIPLTGYCNRECDHCYDDSGPSRERKEMDIETAKSIMNQAVDLGIKHIQLTGGGEPTLYSEFKKLAKCGKILKQRGRLGENKFKILSLVTNGWFITGNRKKNTGKFRKYVGMGFDKIDVSSSRFHVKQNPAIKNLEVHNNYRNVVYSLDTSTAIRGMGRARTVLGIETSECRGASKINIIMAYPDGYHMCCFHRNKIGDLDEPLQEVVERMYNDPFLRAMGIPDFGDEFFPWLQENYKDMMGEDGLDISVFDGISCGDVCTTCDRITSDVQYSDILREASLEYLSQHGIILE